MLQDTTLLAAITDYIEGYSLVELNLQPTTIKNKRLTLQRLLTFLAGKPLSISTIRLYQIHLQKHGWSPASIKQELKIIKAFTNFLYKRKYMTEHIGQDLTYPKVHKQPIRLITPELAEQVILTGTKIGPGDRSRSIFIKGEVQFALRFALRTGLRISEIIKLKGSDLNLDDDPATFYVHSKGGNIDVMVVPPDLLEALKERVHNKRLFTVTQETCNDVLQRGAKELGIPYYKEITNHTLRHIFATSNIKRGMPLQIVSRALRHSSIKMTDDAYSHFDNTDIAKVIHTQPLVRKGLTLDEKFDLFETAAKQTGLLNDSDLHTEISRNANEIVIRIAKSSPLH